MRCATPRPARDVLFLASSGHELGHLGLDAFIARRPGLVPAAKAWIHLGANIGAAQGPGNNLQASDDAMESMMADAMTKAGLRIDRRHPRGAVPRGEAANVHAGRALHLHHRQQRPVPQYARSGAGRGRPQRHRTFRRRVRDWSRHRSPAADNVRSGKPLLPVARPAAALFGLGQRGCAAHAAGPWRPRSWPQLRPDRPVAAAAFSCAGP